MEKKVYHFEVGSIETVNSFSRNCTLKLKCKRGKYGFYNHEVYLHFSIWYIPYIIRKLNNILNWFHKEIESVKNLSIDYLLNKEIDE